MDIMNNIDPRPLTPYTRDVLLKKIKAQMSSHRFEHVLRVEQAAIELAQHYEVNVQKASLAALIHDYAKERPQSDIEDVMTPEEKALILPFGNNIWHGMIGAKLAQKELEIQDTEVLEAMKYHTTGHVHMSKVAQILFLADYIESGRTFDGVEVARKKAYESLEVGVQFKLQRSVAFLASKNQPIFPLTLEAYNAWNHHIILK